MRIAVSNIGLDGLSLEEDYSSKELDLDTQDVKFVSPIHIKGHVSKAINLVTLNLEVTSKFILRCCRCLKEIEQDFNRNINLNIAIDKNTKIIDIAEDFRQELVLEYPLKPLCQKDCLGLCLMCGEDLNSGKCNCN